MIDYRTGDILQEDAEAVVNTVNCVGVMGRGIALQFKKAFPENFKAYAAACKQGKVRPGDMFVWERDGLLNPRYIVNFPTKRHWRGRSRMEDIESGLQALARVVREKRIQSIAVPPLGCGLGGLNWREVRARIEDALSPLEDVAIVVYEPQGAPRSEDMVRSRKAPKMTPGRAALVELIRRYLAGLLDPMVTLLEVHKLMYFMQAAGEPLQLEYREAPYGPYAEKLRHVLNRIEGHFVSGYADGGDAPTKQISLMPGASEKAAKFLENHLDTRERFERVIDLVEGFESPYGLELLSTVHWVVQRDGFRSVEDVVNRTYAWGERKRQFTERQIALACDTLASRGWIDKKA